MFKKKNETKPEKAKELKRSDECDNLSKMFKTKIRVETDARTYVTTFYAIPLQKDKCCKIF